MAKFKVGDICIGQGFTAARYLHLNGMECTVLEVIPVGTAFPGYFRGHIRHLDGLGYKIRWADGETASVVEYCLRKKPPKVVELGDWDAIEKITKGWNPTKAYAL